MLYYHRKVLEVLKEKGPMRHNDLWREVNCRLEAEGRQPVTLQSFYIKPLAKQGYIKNWKPCRKVSYWAITEKGIDALLTEPQRKRKYTAKFHQAIFEHFWYREPLEKAIDAGRELGWSDQEILQRIYKKAVRWLGPYALRGYSGYAQGLNEIVEWLRSRGFQLTDEELQEAIRKAHEDLRWKELCHDHFLATGERLTVKQMKELYGGRLPEEPKSVPTEKVKCYFCGAPIIRSAAVQDAELLKKFTGADSAVVCCSCYNALKWAEKYLYNDVAQYDTDCTCYEPERR